MNTLRAFAFSRAGTALIVSIACCPVLRWYLARVTDGSDEPWGLLALVAAVCLAPRDASKNPLTPRQAWILSGLLATYIAGSFSLPPLVLAIVFVTGLAVSMARKGFPLAWWALLVLSLPVIASLQFYLGYPLRLATTLLCVPLLRLFGLHVSSDATTLHWAGEVVVVDAPCSGIHMLWTGLLLAATLACWQNLNGRATARLLRRASTAVFAANVFRAAALFCIETKIWPSPSWAHEGVGLVLFAGAVTAIIATRLGRSKTDSSATAIVQSA